MQVRKRNGKLEPYNKEKIYKAVLKAALSEDVFDFEEIAAEVMDAIDTMLQESRKEIIDIEEIQDLVEIELYTTAENPRLAKSYILFRDERKREREKANRFKNIILKRALKPDEANVKGNANVDENSFGARLSESAEDIWKEIALDEFIPEDIAELHRSGQLYLHDLSRFALGQTNCAVITFEKLFKNGIIVRNSGLRPPKRFSTACQLVAVILQQSSLHQFGGIAAGKLDHDLSPFAEMSYLKCCEKFYNIGGKELVEKEYKNELRQGAESLVHNLSSLQSRSGLQLPFSSIDIGTDTSRYGRDVIRAILQAEMNGVGNFGLTPAFPIICFRLKDGVNKKPGDPNYDLKLMAIECCCKRLTPNFVNINAVPYVEEDIDTWLTAMGCRTQMGKDIHNPTQPLNKMGRGNAAPHTINPVPIAIEYGICTGKRTEPDLDGFLAAYDNLLAKAEESLLIRANIIFKQKMKAAYEYYANHFLSGDYEYDPEASVYEVIKHSTWAIGLIGLSNAMVALFGKHHAEDPEVLDFAKKLCERHKAFCDEATKRNQLNFSSYASPAENCCYTLMKKMKQQYGEIPGVTDQEFLNNSYHVPVYYPCTPFEKIDIESQFSNLFPGGNITYFEVDSNGVDNIRGIETIIDYACEKQIPYIAFNVPLDECPKCGYKSNAIPKSGCPKCGAPDENILRIRRVTGYINSSYTTSFNAGKQAEVEARVYHTGTEVPIE